MVMRSPHGGLNNDRVRAALYYARKRRLKRLSGGGPGPGPGPALDFFIDVKVENGQIVDTVRGAGGITVGSALTIVGNEIVFDGTDNSLITLTRNGDDITARDFEIETVITPANGIGNRGLLSDRGLGDSTTAYSLAFLINNETASLRASTITLNNQVILTATGMETDVKKKVNITFNSTTLEVIIYIDDVLSATGTLSSALKNVNLPWIIGGYGTGSNQVAGTRIEYVKAFYLS